MIKYIFLLLLLPLTSQASTLMDYVERAISQEEIQAFTSSSITLKTCENCSPEVISLKEDVQFFNGIKAVSRAEAQSLLQVHKRQDVSIFYWRHQMKTDKVVINPPSELELDTLINKGVYQ